MAAPPASSSARARTFSHTLSTASLAEAVPSVAPGSGEDDEEEGRLLRSLSTLHSRLASLAECAAAPATEAAAPEPVLPRVLVVSLLLRVAGAGESWGLQTPRPGVTGNAFFAAVDALSRHCGPGRLVRVAIAQGVPEERQAAVRAALAHSDGVVAFFVTQALSDLASEYLDSALVPVLHSTAVAASQIERHAATFEAFAALNAVVAEALATIVGDGDIVLAHGPGLVLLPSLLRSRLLGQSGQGAGIGRDATLAVLLESPVPSEALYRCLPSRSEVLTGLLGADLVCVQDEIFARHLCDATTQLLGHSASPSSGVRLGDRIVSILVAPLGAEPGQWSLLAPPPASNGDSSTCGPESTLAERSAMRRALASGAAAGPLSSAVAPPGGGGSEEGGDVRLILAIDEGVDSTRGLFLKLLAFEDLLEKHAELRGSTAFVYLLPPSADDRDRGAEQAALLSALHEGVGRIIGRFGTPTFSPVRLLRTPLSHRQLVVLMSIVDAGLFTSLRDGLPAAALEFAAAQVGTSGPDTAVAAPAEAERGPGVVLVSEFAGCVKGLSSGALTVNPVDTRRVAAALHAALTMSCEERALRHGCVLAFARHHAASRWAQRLIAAARNLRAGAIERRALARLDVDHVLASFTAVGLALRASPLEQAESGAARRLLVVGYDGVFLRGGALELGAPSARLRLALVRLAADPRNVVLLHTSAIPADTLAAWFGPMPIGILAENGALIRSPPPCAEQAAAAELLLAPLSSEAAAEAHEDASAAAAAGSAAAAAASSQLLRHERLLSQSHSCDGLGIDPAPALWSRFGGASEDPEWLREARDIFRYFAERTPGASLQALTSSLVLSWTAADDDFGPLQARDLLVHTRTMLRGEPGARVALSEARKEVTVTLSSLADGAALRHILCSEQYGQGFKPQSGPGEAHAQQPYFDFALFLLPGGEGDDGAFALAKRFPPARAFAVAVGRKADSAAAYFVESPSAALSVLEALAGASV